MSVSASLLAGLLPVLVLLTGSAVLVVAAQEQTVLPATEVLAELNQATERLREQIRELQKKPEIQTGPGQKLLADVRVYEKAVAWMLRFEEFPKAAYLNQLKKVLAEGKRRAELLQSSRPDWNLRRGTSIRGYVSVIDGSVQPYAVTLPEGIDPADARRWPLHVVLHGRADQMNEVNFIDRMDGRGPGASKTEAPGEWIQLDVYGRGNNAYRWAGEKDVFEAIADVRNRFRIDEDRVTLHGFSMGGAGAWHLGLHYPHVWSSVGPGAGFVDFYRYQKKDPNSPKDRLPFTADRTLGIYDSVNYAMNAFNVPVCTYGGELDPQLLASTTIRDETERLGIPLRLIVGPGMGHEFDPASRAAFIEFHLEKSKQGRPRFGERRAIRFTTHTLKYNRCDWLSIEEVDSVYEPSTVDAQIEETGEVTLTTRNVRILRLAREIASWAVINGVRLECRAAAESLLPDVWYQRRGEVWNVVGYRESRELSRNPDGHKRPGLQGPIDDAFMSSFVCVRGTGQAANARAAAWAEQSLQRFQQEFAKWMRGDIRIVNDTEVTDEMVAESHLILFGEPQSNQFLKKVLPTLPVKWESDVIQVGDQKWTAADHGLVLIYPNPLNRQRYIVVNSGHTFHEKDFQSSNAWLFPRLGDIAVQQLKSEADGRVEETTVWSEIFDANWRLGAVNGK